MTERYRAYTASGDPVFGGELVDGAVSFDAGDVVISSVIFYDGPVEAEVVSGSVIVNHSGPVSVMFTPVEADPVEAVIIEAAGEAGGVSGA